MSVLDQIVVVIISYKWNFLAEGVINNLPWDTGFNLPVMLIHANKTPEHIARFWTPYDGLIRQIRHEGPFQHHNILNMLTSQPPTWIDPFQWIVMLDHDAFFDCSWLELKEWLIAIIDRYRDKALIANDAPQRRKEVRVFYTCPLMLIKTDDIAWLKYPMKWDITLTPTGFFWRDTGQELGKLLVKDNALGLYDSSTLPRFNHVGITWMKQFTPYDYLNEDMVRMTKNYRHDFIHAYRRKLFVVQPYEIEQMIQQQVHTDITQLFNPSRFKDV